jgi:hypothetical protein
MFACNVAEGERRGTSTLAWQAKPISRKASMPWSCLGPLAYSGESRFWKHTQRGCSAYRPYTGICRYPAER